MSQEVVSQRSDFPYVGPFAGTYRDRLQLPLSDVALLGNLKERQKQAVTHLSIQLGPTISFATQRLGRESSYTWTRHVISYVKLSIIHQSTSCFNF